jgi:hypothetical protein
VPSKNCTDPVGVPPLNDGVTVAVNVTRLLNAIEPALDPRLVDVPSSIVNCELATMLWDKLGAIAIAWTVSVFATVMGVAYVRELVVGPEPSTV